MIDSATSLHGVSFFFDDVPTVVESGVGDFGWTRRYPAFA